MDNATRRVEVAGLPVALDVEHFAQARIQELEFLDAAVAAVSADVASARGDGGGRVDSRRSGKKSDVGTHSSVAGGLHDQSQAVPRHMRRRTTSHKPRRMPVALKNRSNPPPTSTTSKSRQSRRIGEAGTGDQDQGGDARPQPEEARRCRKHRRRPRALLAMHSPHAAEEAGTDDGSGCGEGSGKKIVAPRRRWLETHIWHAKRMHMKEKWGFMLPVESNRGPRAAAEAALKHCTVQDITFMRPIELRGPRQCILGALSVLTDPMDSRPTHQNCMNGSVEACTHLYRLNEFPLGCIAPVSLLWGPSDSNSGDGPSKAPAPAGESDGGNGTQKGGAGDHDEEHEKDGMRGGEEEEDGEEGGEVPGDVRRMWMWVHPAAAEEALREIRKACALEGSPWQGGVQAAPVRGGLCRLRVRGARSHETVQRVLRTAPASRKTAADAAPAEAEALGGFEDAARDNAGHWQALAFPLAKPGGGSVDNRGIDGGGGGPRLLPPGSVLAITALDPRERHQSRQRRPGAGAGGGGTSETQAVVGNASDASKNAEPVSAAAAAAAAAVVERWPPPLAAVSPLWDPDARALSAGLAAARPDHVINDVRRRQRAREAWENSDGAPPPGDDAGGATPVILVSSSGAATLAHGGVSMAASTATAAGVFRGDGGASGGDRRGRASGKTVERKRRALAAGWDVILPPGWAPVFFGALVMAGARALSLRDADGLRLESGEPCFPIDFPDTAAGHRHWDQIGQEAEAAWTRTRPKHRGFRRRPPPPPGSSSRPIRSPPLPAGAEERGEAITGDNTIGGGGGGGAGGAGTGAECQTAAIKKPGCQEERQQDEPTRGLAPPSLSPSAVSGFLFRPNFGSLAAGGVPTSTDSGAAPETTPPPPTGDGEVRDAEGVEGPTGTAGGEATIVETSRRCDESHGEGKREAFAVARGFHYATAFLPDAEEEGIKTSSSLTSGDAGGDGGGRAGLALSPPSPLRLAFPTVLELMILQDKGVPKPGTLIHAASPEHHALWIQGKQGCKPWPGLSSSPTQPWSSPSSSLVSKPAAVSTATAAASVSAPAGSLCSGHDPAPAAATALTAMGAVTTGGFSFLRGGGVGRAVCEAVAVRDALWVSLSCSRRDLGVEVAVERQHRRQHALPWALVLVENEAGSWLRPAVASVADC